jgi:biotin carboxyl carrier protein
MDPSAVASTVLAPMQTTVVSIDVRAGEVVRSGQQLVVLESMKMQHVVAAQTSGLVTTIAVAVGQPVDAGQELLALDRAQAGAAVGHDEDDVDLDAIRPT